MDVLKKNNVLSRSIIAKDIMDELKKDIITKKISAETKLTEDILLRKYDVSRVPVRSALRVLAEQGFLEFRKNGVHYVPNFSIKYFEDIYDIRILLEKKAVDIIFKLDFVNYTPLLQSLNVLKERLQAQKTPNTNKNDNINNSLLALHIHYYIVEISDNKALLHAWNTISNFTQVFMRLNLNKVSLKESFETHNVLCSAIIQKSPNCLKILEDHIKESKTIFLNQYKKFHSFPITT